MSFKKKLNFNCASSEFNSLFLMIKGIANLCSIFYKNYPDECDVDMIPELSAELLVKY